MSNADTFGRYVGILAETLDDHTTSSAQLAQRLYTSRFHLDRIVSSVGGEPPATLRRRLLLERAAYRLITSEHRILDVGVEAGYASHEAFTRAFAVTSVWRHATSVRIQGISRSRRTTGSIFNHREGYGCPAQEVSPLWNY